MTLGKTSSLSEDSLGAFKLVYMSAVPLEFWVIQWNIYVERLKCWATAL